MGLLERTSEWFWKQTLASRTDGELTLQEEELLRRLETNPWQREKLNRMLGAVVDELARRVGLPRRGLARDVEYLKLLAESLNLPPEIFSPSEPLEPLLAGWSAADLAFLRHRLAGASDMEPGYARDAVQTLHDRIQAIRERPTRPFTEEEIGSAISKVYGADE